MRRAERIFQPFSYGSSLRTVLESCSVPSKPVPWQGLHTGDFQLNPKFSTFRTSPNPSLSLHSVRNTSSLHLAPDTSVLFFIHAECMHLFI